MRIKPIPVVVVLVIAAGFLLRLYRLGVVPLRGDEAFTVQNWMALPLSESLSRIATIEPHPFLNYVVFRLWGLVTGTGEFSARYLPALVNVLGIPACYALGTRLLNRRVAVLAAFLWAFHPFLIWHSQDARNYAVWAGLSAVALWLGLRAVQSNRLLNWVLYLVAALLAANIFYFEWFTLLGFLLFVIVEHRQNKTLLLRIFGVQGIVFLTSLLSFWFLQAQLIASGGYGGTTGTGLDVTRLFTWFLPVFYWGESLPDSLLLVLAVLLAIMFFFALMWLWHYKQRYALGFIACVGFFPLLLLSGLSLWFDVFAPRYVLAVVPPFILILAFTVDFLLKRIPFVGMVIFTTWLLLASLSYYNLFFVPDYAKYKPWPAAADYLEARVTPDDLIIQLSVDPAFGFYYNGEARDIGLPANPAQPEADIHRELEAVSRRYNSIWLVGQTFPDWPNYGVVERWLRDNMQPVRETEVSGLHVRQYMPWQVNELSPEMLTVFPDVAELVGARALLPPEPTAELTVWLYWNPVSTTGSPYKVFVHLVGTANPATGTPLWSQDDRYPQNGRISTVDWMPAAIYRDIYILPLKAVPAGEYELRIGFYNPDTGERVRLLNGDDSFHIQTINLP